MSTICAGRMAVEGSYTGRRVELGVVGTVRLPRHVSWVIVNIQLLVVSPSYRYELEEEDTQGLIRGRTEMVSDAL